MVNPIDTAGKQEEEEEEADETDVEKTPVVPHLLLHALLLKKPGMLLFALPFTFSQNILKRSIVLTGVLGQKAVQAQVLLCVICST